MSDKKKSAVLFWIFAAVNLVIFILFYTIRYLPSQDISEPNEALEYVRGFLSEAVDFILPIAIAASAFVLSSGKRISLCLYTLLFSSARFFYLFLYYYLYWTAYGNDFIESSLLSVAVSIAGIAVFFIRALLLSCVTYLVAALAVTAEQMSEMPPKKRADLTASEKRALLFSSGRTLPDRFGEGDMFDLSRPIARGIFVGALIEFAYSLVLEIIDTVRYLVEYAGSYTIGEIIYITVSFVMLIFELLIAHTICRLIEKKFSAKNDAKIIE